MARVVKPSELEQPDERLQELMKKLELSTQKCEETSSILWLVQMPFLASANTVACDDFSLPPEAGSQSDAGSAEAHAAKKPIPWVRTIESNRIGLMVNHPTSHS